MSPLSADNSHTAGTSRPPGVLPKNINYVVLSGIALLVVCASLFSGKKTAKPEQANTTVGPSSIQLRTFQQMLERQRQEAEAEKKRLEALALANTHQTQPVGDRSLGTT